MGSIQGGKAELREEEGSAQPDRLRSTDVGRPDGDGQATKWPKKACAEAQARGGCQTGRGDPGGRSPEERTSEAAVPAAAGARGAGGSVQLGQQARHAVQQSR